jgi:hypothetical protein
VPASAGSEASCWRRIAALACAWRAWPRIGLSDGSVPRRWKLSSIAVRIRFSHTPGLLNV